MRDNDRLDLDALRADPGARERVVSAAMARIRSRPPGATSILAGSSRYLVPVLAAAAVVGLLLGRPGADGSPTPDGRVQGAGVLLEAAGDVADPWLRWSLADQRPDPRELLVRFAGAP